MMKQIGTLLFLLFFYTALGFAQNKNMVEGEVMVHDSVMINENVTYWFNGVPYYFFTLQSINQMYN